MKTSKKIKVIITISVFIFQTQFLFAQWSVGTAGIFKFGRTNPALGINPIGIGIGNFPNGAPPQSALHINTNTPFPTNPFFTQGELFRTTGPANLDNSWRMLTGTGNGTERFSITVPANTDEVVLQTTQNGAMRFNTNNTQRQRLNGSLTNPLLLQV